jgi:molybdenum cofactor cytidylyltransferase
MKYYHGFSAVILAAGFSRRMGEFKPLMNLGGRTVLSRILSLYHDAGVMDIRVVTGHRANAIRSALYAHPATVVHNPVYDSGMFSSVVAGIDSLPVTSHAFFIHPVDIPLVQSHTLSLLSDAFNERSPAVVYPVFNGIRGHPPLIHRELKDAIASNDGCGGLRSILLRFDSKAQDIAVADEGVLLDLDTPGDYQRLSARLATVDRPAGKKRQE